MYRSATLQTVTVLPGEVQLRSREPGRAPLVFTRTEAIALAAELHGALLLPEPRIARPTLWRRFTDGWLRFRTNARRRADIRLAERAAEKMGVGETKHVVYK